MPLDSSVELQVVEDLIRASRIFVAIAGDSLAGDGAELTLQQYRALALLSSHGNQRPADLARSLSVTPSTATALCDRLVHKGMISRRRRGTDRRSVALLVSARGHEQLKKIEARRGDLLSSICTQLSPSSQAQLAEMLPAFLKAADEAGVDEWSIRGLVVGPPTGTDGVE